MDKRAVLNSKRLIVFISCVVSVVLAFTGLAIFSLFDINQWVGVGIGGGVIIVCAVLAIAVKKAAYIPVIIVNALAFGIAISSMYTHFGYFPPAWQTALVTVGTILLFGVFCLLSKTPLFKNHCVICTAVYLICVLAAEILLTIFVSAYLFGFALFLYLTLASHVIVLTVKVKDFDDLVANLAACSFTVLIIAVIVVIIVITQGDGADGVGDFLSGAAPSKSKTKKRDPFNFELLK